MKNKEFELWGYFYKIEDNNLYKWNEKAKKWASETGILANLIIINRGKI